jgi:hypothetical protein
MKACFAVEPDLKITLAFNQRFHALAIMSKYSKSSCTLAKESFVTTTYLELHYLTV